MHQAAHGGSVVDGQAMGHAGAAVVGQHVEVGVAQRLHDTHHVAGHHTLGVVAVVRRAGWSGRAAVATQVGQHQGEMPGEPGRHLVPDGMGLGVAVQQQQRAAPAAGPHADVHAAVGRDVLRGEAGEEVVGVHG